MIIKKVKAKSRGYHYICQCDACGKEFKQYAVVVERSKKNYCSADCKKEGMSKYNSGKNHPFYGKKHKADTKEKMSANRSGDKNWRWQGGKFISSLGYVMVKSPNHPRANRFGYVQEHRLVMEKKLGRYLKSKEIVHHIDGNRQNNRIENLMLFETAGKHTAHHKKLLKQLLNDKE